MPLAWRHATDADVPGLVSLIRAAYRQPGGWSSEAHLVQGERIDASGALRLIAAADSVTPIVDGETRPLACCHLAHAAGVVELGTFAVDPTRQAVGVGRWLIAAAAAHAVAAWGARTAQITVLDAMPALVAWYERRGFRATGETRPFPADDRYAIALREGLRFVVMTAPLQEVAGGR